MNKIEKFAIAMSELLFEMRIESEIIYVNNCLNTGTEVPVKFVDETLDNEEHVNKIKEQIKLDIVHHLTERPNDWKNEKGEYMYHNDTYDYADNVCSYVGRLYEDTNETKSVWICPDCRSDNVQFKTWTNANTMTATNDECPMEDGDCHCLDCESTSILEIVIMMPRRKLIGFQVNAIDGVGHKDMHPNMKSSSSVYNLNQANEMIINSNDIDCELKTIWTDDIEEPIMMFEGNVR